MPKRQTRKTARITPEGGVPFIDIEGTAAACGVRLGYAWAEALRYEATRMPDGARPWWKLKRFGALIDRFAPHLPTLFRGMAEGAGLPEDKVSTQTPVEPRGHCTSFAVQPAATLDGGPLAGQTKDTGGSRVFQYRVLRLKMSDAPSALTLTYPGWLFGHGFVEGGCAIFRNSLYAGEMDGALPYDVWGLLALHCRSVDEVVEMTRQYGIAGRAHTTVLDAQGGVVGLEMGRGGLGVLKPKKGIYTHGNHVASPQRLRRFEEYGSRERACSLHRQDRLREQLEADRGRLTAQLAWRALSDHTEYPMSICRHADNNTTSAVVAEPARGRLHVARGCPCQNWPKTYQL